MNRIAEFSAGRARALRRHATGGMAVMVMVGLGSVCGLAFARAPFAYVLLVMAACLGLASFYGWRLLILRQHLARQGDVAIFTEGDDLVVFAPYRARLRLGDLYHASIEHVAHRGSLVEVITFKARGKVLRVEAALYELPARQLVERVTRLMRTPSRPAE